MNPERSFAERHINYPYDLTRHSARIGVCRFKAGKTLERLLGDAGIRASLIFRRALLVRWLAGMGEVVRTFGKCAWDHDGRLDAPAGEFRRVRNGQWVHRGLRREIRRQER